MTRALLPPAPPRALLPCFRPRASTPAEVAAAALSYEGAPYQHLGRSRTGLDCLGLLVLTAKDCGQLEPEFDYLDYTRDTAGYVIAENLRPKMRELSDWRGARPGDVLLQRFNCNLPPSHILVVTRREGEAMWAVHASVLTGRVVEQRVCHLERITHAFRLKGVTHG